MLKLCHLTTWADSAADNVIFKPFIPLLPSSNSVFVSFPTPAGKLTSEQIRAGYTALQRIEECLKKKGNHRLLLEACNQFYTRIPHDFGWGTRGARGFHSVSQLSPSYAHYKMLFCSLKTPPIINTEEELKEKIALLEVKGFSIDLNISITYIIIYCRVPWLIVWSMTSSVNMIRSSTLLWLKVPVPLGLWDIICCFCFPLQALSDIQIAVKMVQSSEGGDEHPLDRQYSSLQCKLQPMDSSSDEFKVCVLCK